MNTLHHRVEIHQPTDADFRDSFDWQQTFEGSDLLQKAIPATERFTGAGLEVLQKTAYYNSRFNEMYAHVDLAIQVDVSLRTAPNQAYWQIAQALRSLADELLIGMGEDTSETIGDVFPPEPSHGWKPTAWWLTAVGGGALFCSAIFWLAT